MGRHKPEERTTAPWKFIVKGDSRDMGGIYGGYDYKELVCHFGDCEQYYPSQGEPPNLPNTRLIINAPRLYNVLTCVLPYLPPDELKRAQLVLSDIDTPETVTFEE